MAACGDKVKETKPTETPPPKKEEPAPKPEPEEPAPEPEPVPQPVNPPRLEPAVVHTGGRKRSGVWPKVIIGVVALIAFGLVILWSKHAKEEKTLTAQEYSLQNLQRRALSTPPDITIQKSPIQQT